MGGAPGAAGSSVGLGIMVGGVGGVAAGSSSGQLDREVLRKMMQVRGNVFSWTSTWGVGVEGVCCNGVRMKLHMTSFTNETQLQAYAHGGSDLLLCEPPSPDPGDVLTCGVVVLGFMRVVI